MFAIVDYPAYDYWYGPLMTRRKMHRLFESPMERQIRDVQRTLAMMLYDDSRELNFTFAYDNHIMSSGYTDIPDRLSAYERVTPERIRAAAEVIFTPANLTLTMKGKRGTDPDKLREILLTL